VQYIGQNVQYGTSHKVKAPRSVVLGWNDTRTIRVIRPNMHATSLCGILRPGIFFE